MKKLLVLGLLLCVSCAGTQKQKVCDEVEKAHSAAEDVYTAAHAACVAPTGVLGSVGL